MTKQHRINGSIHLPRRATWLRLAALCLSALFLWGCEGPQEPKETPATTTPENPTTTTPDPGTAQTGTEIFFSYQGVRGNSFEISEAINRAPIEVTLEISPPLSADLNIAYGIPNTGSAKRDLDYITVGAEFVGQGTASWSATIPKGTSSFKVSPAFIVSDGIYEGPESLTLTFQTAGGSRSVDFTIKDDEKPPSVYLAFTDKIDGTEDKGILKESAGSITLHATLVGSESSPFPIRIPLSFASDSGGATIGVDFRVPGRFTPDGTSSKPDECPMLRDVDNPSVLVIPPNTKEIDFAILVNDDFAAEPNNDKKERVTITAHTPNIRAQNVICGSLLSNKLDANSVVASRALTLTIVDDETNGRINPTGVTTCAVANQTSVPCTDPAVVDFPNQDGHTGSATSYLEPYGATTCMLDTNTKLVWEAKTSPNEAVVSRHGAHHTYTWRDERSNINGGKEGDLGGLNSCNKTELSCDTAEYIKKVNNEIYCGHFDWRLPTVKELLSLVRHSLPESTERHARIDTGKFPFTSVGGYWTTTPSAMFSAAAWVVDFSDGRVYPVDKSDSLRPYFIRLVRNADE